MNAMPHRRPAGRPARLGQPLVPSLPFEAGGFHPGLAESLDRERGPAMPPACLLVAEPTPLLLLSLLGRYALDLLLVPGTEVRIADTAADGLPPGWLSDHAGRVGLQRTRYGVLAHGRGASAETGRADVLGMVDAVSHLAGGGRGVLAIADDAEARAEIRGRDYAGVSLASTRGFLTWIAAAFGVSEATRARGELAAIGAGGRA